jgi:hypothetical protein
MAPRGRRFETSPGLLGVTRWWLLDFMLISPCDLVWRVLPTPARRGDPNFLTSRNVSMIRPTIQERAYQLTATLRTLPKIRGQLMREGYENVDGHLAPPQFRLAVKRMCRAAAKLREADAESME